MLNRTDVAALVRKVIVVELGVEPGKVLDSAHLMTDLGADSLDLIELQMAFEDDFGCELSDAQLEGVLTVGGVIDLYTAHGTKVEDVPAPVEDGSSDAAPVGPVD